MPEALRAISCEALALPTSDRAATRAHRGTRDRNFRMESPSEGEPPGSCPVRGNYGLGGEPLGVLLRHGHLQREAEERVHHGRVELCPGTVAQPAAGLLAAQPLAV